MGYNISASLCVLKEDFDLAYDLIEQSEDVITGSADAGAQYPYSMLKIIYLDNLDPSGLAAHQELLDAGIPYDLHMHEYQDFEQEYRYLRFDADGVPEELVYLKRTEQVYGFWEALKRQYKETGPALFDQTWHDIGWRYYRSDEMTPDTVLPWHHQSKNRLQYRVHRLINITPQPPQQYDFGFGVDDWRIFRGP